MDDVPKTSVVMFAISTAITTVLIGSGFVSNVVTEKGITNLYIVTLVVAGIGALFGFLVVRKLVLTGTQLLLLGQIFALILLLPCLAYLVFKIVWGDPVPPPASEVKPIATASAHASAHEDCRGDWFTYEPEKAIDQKDDTAWRVPGNGKKQWIELDYSRPVVVNEVIAIPGHDKIDSECDVDRFYQLYVVRRASIEFRDATGHVVTEEQAKFEHDRSRQPAVTLNSPIVARSVRIIITDVYPPDSDDPVHETAISEIELE